MQEGTLHLWALSLNHLASINNAMKLLAGSSVKRSEQHSDLVPSRLTQDHTDWKRFKDWLTARNPFTFEDSNLHSLSTGFISIAGEDEISCDDSERIGANTQAGMNGKRFTQVRFKRNDQAKPLDWWLVREYSNHRWSESIYQLNSIVYEISCCCKRRGERRVLLLLWNDKRADVFVQEYDHAQARKTITSESNGYWWRVKQTWPYIGSK